MNTLKVLPALGATLAFSCLWGQPVLAQTGEGEASLVLKEASLLVDAAKEFKSQTGRYPRTILELLEGGQLQTAPQAPDCAEGSFQIEAPLKVFLVLKPAASDVCEALNASAKNFAKLPDNSIVGCSKTRAGYRFYLEVPAGE
jgi:hypothetical protein